MTFILIFSMMINMAAILAIVILYLRQNRLIQLEKDYKEYTKEIEDLIHTFIIEMKEENNDIKQLFMNRDGAEPFNEETRIPGEESATDVTGLPKGYLQNIAVNAYGGTDKQSGTANKMEGKRDSAAVTYQNQLLTEVLNMKNQGYTIEETAKKLGRGKTEIELLLKLNQK